jgi:two-component system, chemotaxis family, CheB/CheR fusion protein
VGSKLPTKKKRPEHHSEPRPAAVKSFPIVGVGASAGGFEAFGEMLHALPTDTGMAFVLIQHLDPTHESMLAPLLARKSALPVNQVVDGMAVEPNHVYVIPPNTRMGIQDGLLKLSKRAATGEKNMPIDYFFQSLAASCKDAAIGVILSGTATDGTFGLKAIKEEGGICFAQDEESAKYPGMPASAIAAGCVDFALPPRKIAAELTRIARHQPSRLLASGLGAAFSPALPAGNDGHIRKLFLLLRNATGADFTYYKSSTIHRRIARRMLLKKIGTLREYVELLRRDGAELDALYQDILIHVTSFFREPETFQILETQIVPKLIDGKTERDALRVWVPGCSTGEEAYSIAIVLAEYFGDRLGKVPVQIFATDLSEGSIEQARAGVYTGATLAEVGPERLARFFVNANGSFQVTQAIRDLCTFARQDLTQDPPFSRIDLISCRNVLIYLEPVLQKRILGAFHYALRDKGFLLLGKSETLNAYPDLFTLADKGGKFFRKKASVNNLQFTASASQGRAGHPGKPIKPATPLTDLQKEADRLVWSRYAHSGVIVDENLQILHFRGDTSPYLAPASGAASLHLLKMIKGDLLVDLRAAFHKSKKENTSVKREGIRVTSGGRAHEVSIEVVPLSALDSVERHFLILFEEVQPEPHTTNPKAPDRRKAEVAPSAKLKQELLATREYLQAIIEEQETTNEELKAANEEVLSNNEELQSTNEELETAKEELQSTNEELVTLTEQQGSRNVELTQLNDDLRNVLDGIRIPILMLGSDRRIRRFTPSAEKLFNLLPTDVGRPIQNLRPNLDLPDLQPLILRTIDTLTLQEQDVRDLEGHYYSMTVRPYRTSDNRIDGVLIALVDTDALKRSLEEVRRARDFATAIVETVREPLVVLDSRLRVVTANLSFYSAFRISPEQVEKQGIFELAGGAWDIPDLRNLLGQILPGNTQFSDFRLSHVFPRIGRRTLLLNARRLRGERETGELILLAVEDLTDREWTTEALQESRERLRDLTAGLLTAQEEERRRISRELHDDLNQRLAMFTVELETLEQNPLQSAELIRSQLAALRTRTVDLSDEVRRTAHRLHPSMVEHLGLPAALRSLCADFSKQEKMRIDYRERNLDGQVPAETALCLYRVTQEALRNVVKHSGARRATVSLVAAKDRIVLSISDSGVGFDPENVRDKKGLGIISMEERVRLVVGELNIRSKPGNGTRVVVQVPLPEHPLSKEQNS